MASQSDDDSMGCSLHNDTLLSSIDGITSDDDSMVCSIHNDMLLSSVDSIT